MAEKMRLRGGVGLAANQLGLLKKVIAVLIPIEPEVDEDGNEFWYARELQKGLEYKEWRNFSKVIEKAKEACEKAGNVEISHFVDANKIDDFTSRL